MNKKEIKRQIDSAVKVFKQLLEKTYLEKNRPFYGIGYDSLTNFFTGKISHTRKNNGNLRICGDISNVMFQDNLVGLPDTFDDWKIFPLVIRLFNVSEESFKKDKKVKKK